MEHPFTWYNLLPDGWQHAFGDHTFFALIAVLLLILFALSARGALAKAQDPAVPAAELGSRNIAELLVQLIVSQSDAIIGKAGRKYVPFYGTFFFFILTSNLMGLLPGFGAPTANLNTTIGLALCSFVGYNVIGVREQGVSYFKHFVGPMTVLPAAVLFQSSRFCRCYSFP
jgi:F-type H+-transporting ATPase subunit a